MVDESAFWNRMAARYYAQPIADEAAYRRKLEITQALLKPDMEMFEFGCGTGGTAITHAPFVKHVHAIDFSERMLGRARQQASLRGAENVTFERADITSFQTAPERYDVILGMSILHLLRDPDAAIGKVHAMLRPGGHFVSSTACIGDSMGFFKFLAPIGKALGLLPILNVMTGDQLVAKMEAAGFEIVHRWQPAKDKALFLVCRKPDQAA